MSHLTFADLGVSTSVVRALSERGIDAPFPIQSKVIGDVLAGHDVLVKSPTGSGKTLAFGIPMVDRLQAGGARPTGLVLAPTRELASQIVDELRAVAKARSLSVTAVYGGVSIGGQARSAGKSQLLVATPGRLLDLIDRGAVSLAHVKLLVLDEADRMLDMGFKPAVDRIVAMTPDDRQTMLFSATLDGEIGKIAKVYTRDARRHEHHSTEESRGAIEHRFIRVAHEAKMERLVSELENTERGRTLVFVRTKRGADRLVKRLSRATGVHAAAMHGDKSQAQRERALSQFEDGRIDTLVATDVAARGIDVADITHVINFDVPAAREDYVHRIGRTARAGATGVGITFVLDDQAGDVVKFASDLGLHQELEEGGFSRPERQTRETHRSHGGHRGSGGHRGGGNSSRGRGRGRQRAA
jgi:superfamily II DNA/RNA helicase